MVRYFKVEINHVDFISRLLRTAKNARCGLMSPSSHRLHSKAAYEKAGTNSDAETNGVLQSTDTVFSNRQSKLTTTTTTTKMAEDFWRKLRILYG